VLRHRSYLLISTNVGFSIQAYLKKFAAQLILPDSTVIDFSDVSYTAHTEFDFDGKTMVHMLYLSQVTALRELKPGLGRLRLEYDFNFTGHPDEEGNGTHEHPAIVRSVPWHRDD
jgi:hypothetical protein